MAHFQSRSTLFTVCAATLSLHFGCGGSTTLAGDGDNADATVTDAAAGESGTTSGGGSDATTGGDDVGAGGDGATVGMDSGGGTATDSGGGGVTDSGVGVTDAAPPADGGKVPTHHRPSDSLCQTVPAKGTCTVGFGGLGGCTSDSACTMGTNGRCNARTTGGGPVGGCTCAYDSCQHDTDCAKGELCLCHDSAYYTGGNTCTKGGCRVDADCGAGGYCSPSRAGGCGGVTGYYCHSAADECVDDSDCSGKIGTECDYSTSAGHFTCQTRLLCP